MIKLNKKNQQTIKQNQKIQIKLFNLFNKKDVFNKVIK